jgi:hypothetical protein
MVWSGQQRTFYVSIPDVVYNENSIPLKKEFKDMLASLYQGSHSVPSEDQRNSLVEDYKGEVQSLTRSASGSSRQFFTTDQINFFRYLKGMDLC